MSDLYKRLHPSEVTPENLIFWADKQKIEAEARTGYFLDHLTDRYVFLPTKTGAGQVIDIQTGKPYSVASFNGIYSRLSVWVPKDPQDETKGGKMVKVAPQWKDNINRKTVDGFIFKPNDPNTFDTVKDDGGQTVVKLNLWRPVVFDAEPTEDDVKEAERLFTAYMQHLFPLAEEYAFAMNWVARVIQHPEERGVALVSATRTTGAGREVFFKLLQRMIGTKYVAKLETKDLLRTSSGRFNNEMANRILWFVNEAMTSAKERTSGVNAIKDVLSTEDEMMRIEPKGADPYYDQNYASTFIATNDPRKAVPIEDSNRRIAVVSGPDRYWADRE